VASIFFSGVDRPAHLSLLVAERAAGMINANNAMQPKLQQAYGRKLPIPLALDSPAFQGKGDIAEYVDIVEQVGSHFIWISNLDVVSNQSASNRNFEYLQSHLSPHLRDKILWIYQGGSLSELEDMAQRRKLVGIGGLVFLLRQRGRETVLRYLSRIGECLSRANAQAHVFGIGSPHILFCIRNEGWLASTDSSKWLIAYKASEVLRVDGVGQCSISRLGLQLTTQEMAANNIRVMRIWMIPCGIAQLSLPFDEPEPFPSQEGTEALVRMILLVSGPSEVAFLECIDVEVTGIEGGMEQDECFYALLAPLSLEEAILDCCESACRAGAIGDYDLWVDEEDTWC